MAFWDGTTKGTASTIRFFEQLGKTVTVVIISSTKDQNKKGRKAFAFSVPFVIGNDVLLLSNAP